MFKKILSLSAAIALCTAFTPQASASSLLETLGTVHSLRDYEPTLTEVLKRVAEEAKGKPYSQPEYTQQHSSPDTIPSPSVTAPGNFGKSPSSVFVN